MIDLKKLGENEIIEITIPNWEKYNPPGNVKHPTWFRMQNNIFSNAKFHSLSCAAKVLFWYTLCARSMQGRDKVNTSLGLVRCHIGTVRGRTTYSILEELVKFQLVIINQKHSLPSLQTEQTEQTEQDITKKVTKKKVKDFSDKKSNSISETEKEIFDYWNSQKIIVHKESSLKKYQSAIKGALKDYSIQEIKTAMNNYYAVLNSEDTFWSHKWTLKEFLGRDNAIVKFIGNNFNLKSYVKNSSINKKPDHFDVQRKFERRLDEQARMEETDREIN